MLQQLGPEPVEIVALDFAGHGKSSHRQTEDYSIWRYAEDAVHVANQLGWDRHAVIGHSMGGAVACLYSGLFVSRCENQLPVNISPYIYLALVSTHRDQKLTGFA